MDIVKSYNKIERLVLSLGSLEEVIAMITKLGSISGFYVIINCPRVSALNPDMNLPDNAERVC